MSINLNQKSLICISILVCNLNISRANEIMSSLYQTIIIIVIVFISYNAYSYSYSVYHRK